RDREQPRHAPEGAQRAARLLYSSHRQGHSLTPLRAPRDSIAAARPRLLNLAPYKNFSASRGHWARRQMEVSVAQDVLVSEEMANKFKTEKDTPYLRFVRGEGLDIISAQYVPDLRTVELKPWARRGDGARGVFINHEASRTSNDCYVCE